MSGVIERVGAMGWALIKREGSCSLEPSRSILYSCHWVVIIVELGNAYFCKLGCMVHAKVLATMSLLVFDYSMEEIL